MTTSHALGIAILLMGIFMISQHVPAAPEQQDCPIITTTPERTVAEEIEEALELEMWHSDRIIKG